MNILYIFLSMIMINCFSGFDKQSTPMKNIVINALDFSLQQSLKMAESLSDQPKVLPKTTDRFGNLETCKPTWWVSGFFPGQLWYMYEYSGDEIVKQWAQSYTRRVESQQFNTDTHDVGFMIFCSYGNGYRLTKDESYKKVIYNAAKSLSTRYNKTTKTIRSWDKAEWNKQWQYPVIIDNMMNLELLLCSANEFNQKEFKEIAVQHANTTLKNHFRKDYSSYHVVSYDTVNGMVEKKNTSQGFSDESAWARGQAWGLYGFTVMYRFTKDSRYLKQAENIALFILNHPNLTDDKIPYWDFNAPNIPDCPRDASAAAIICSALLELSTYTDEQESEKYLSVAEIQLRVLSSTQYRNALGNNGNFILKHSVGHMPNHTEVDVPLSYTDYYFVEALMRYKKHMGY
jgi:unsaturated chondroitin disaccharide hydrolase